MLSLFFNTGAISCTWLLRGETWLVLTRELNFKIFIHFGLNSFKFKINTPRVRQRNSTLMLSRNRAQAALLEGERGLTAPGMLSKARNVFTTSCFRLLHYIPIFILRNFPSKYLNKMGKVRLKNKNRNKKMGKVFHTYFAFPVSEA